ncbi:aminotransferase class I/II-fold pyridoxal phosphate-dependent enzyme [Sphaerisporangium flaviroseum]|uniref:Aminotransferase n=1 Tax=Sphaerisporangium flaviroseum TaxID=509199 RepID=A0ABP7IM24_9ACTN
MGLLLDTEELRRRVVDGWIGLYNPYPAEAVDLFHGNPLLPPPACVAEALRDLADSVATDADPAHAVLLHPYRAPEIIAPELEEAAVDDLARDGVPVRPGRREVVCGVGVTQLMAALLQAFGDSGGAVLFPTPTYTFPLLAAAQIGGRAIFLTPSIGELGYEVDVDRIAAALEAHRDIAALFLVNPGNPTGEVLSPRKLAQIAEVVARHPHVVVIVDEIYRHMILNGDAFQSFAAMMFDRTITLRGLSKCYGLARLRVGYAAAARDLLESIAIRTFIWFNTAAPSEVDQLLGAAALRCTPPSYFAWVVRTYRDLLEVVTARLAQINERTDGMVEYVRPAAGSFVLLRMPKVRGRMTRDGQVLLRDGDLSRSLLRRGLAVVPGSVFGIPEYDMVVRITFTSPLNDLLAGLDILESLLVETRTR